jgi:hypothetical protein
MAATLSAFFHIFRCTLIPQKISKFGDSAFPDVPCKKYSKYFSLLNNYFDYLLKV